MCDSPLSSQRVETHLHPHSSHFLLKWSVASPSAPPYSMLATQGVLNLQRVFRNIQNMLRDFQRLQSTEMNLNHPLDGHSCFLLKCFSFQLQSRPHLRRRFERSARTRHSSLSARSRTLFFGWETRFMIPGTLNNHVLMDVWWNNHFRSWNLKHLFINGCFNWMISNLYMGMVVSPNIHL